MNQKYLVAIVSVVVIIAIGTVTYFATTGRMNQSVPTLTSQPVPINGNRCGDGVCGPIEKEKGVCPKDCSDPVGSLNNSFDADGFLWGTEIYPSYLDEKTSSMLTHTLKTNNLKVRLQANFFSKDGKTFSPVSCMPSADNCMISYDFDGVAKKFKDNNWNMVPMLSYDTTKAAVTSEDIDKYVDFVDWFISRYGDDANIKYVELSNDPNKYWKGTAEQLLELNNKAYDRVKTKRPNVLMGTIGFEFWADGTAVDTEKSLQILEYFLKKDNGAKFDFWAFHGYPSIILEDVKNGRPFFYPPTKTALNNKYAGIPGILEIRKKLDANGWNDRLMIDTEHIGIVPSTGLDPSGAELKLDAAYTIQELILKKTLQNKNLNVLSGIMPLKIAPRSSKGEFRFASLNSDGSETSVITAVSFLWDRLSVYGWDSHVSGEFDDENQVWIEKFRSENKELYVFFKPFEYKAGQKISFDNKISDYALALDNQPSSVKLYSIGGTAEDIALSRLIKLEATNEPKYLEVMYGGAE
jgi:hypothetical protein